MSTQTTKDHEPSLKKCLLVFWKGFVDYRNQAGRKEFWIGVAEGLLLIFLINQLIFEYFAVAYAGGTSGKIVFAIQIIFALAVLVALTALVFRRLRNVGLKTLPITILVVMNVALFILKLFFVSAIITVGSLVLGAFMILMFLMPPNAMAVDEENILFYQK